MKKDDQATCISLQTEDFKAAIKGMGSYVDITDEDLMMIYLIALEHAKRRMTGGIAASEVMTRTVISAHIDERLETVLETLNKNKISGLPVVDDHNRVVGVISEAEFVHMLSNEKVTGVLGKISLFFRPEHNSELTIADVMSTPAITRDEKTTLNEIASVMVDKEINRVPIVDKDGLLIGIVTRSDIVRALNMGE